MQSQRKIFIQLGRIGDILNALPLAWEHRERTGEVPLFMVSKEFETVLEGVSYVEPLAFDGEFTETTLAVYQASKLSADVTLPQIYGQGINYRHECSSFARESWYRAGAKMPWGSLPLILDRRDAKREAALYAEVIGDDPRPFVLMALEGKSSPFPYAKSLKEKLTWLFKARAIRVIDISTVKAKRFYDLLGLFEKAKALISIDTGHQHLAAACNVPVVALCTRDPSHWHGSPWRPQQIGRFFYDEFPGAWINVFGSIEYPSIHGSRIIHAWTDRPWLQQSEATRRRCAVARDSWEMEYKTGRWIPAEWKPEMITRTAEEIGDPHPVAFVRDLIKHGLSKTYGQNDIVAITNADVCFVPGLTGRVLEVVSRHGAAFTHRWDFPRIDAPFIHDAQIKQKDGGWYCGSDAFFMSRWWLEKHLEELGDYVLGREYWDQGLRQLIKFHGGREIRHAIYHEAHESFWKATEDRTKVPGNAHNLAELTRWFERTGLKEFDHTYWQVNPEIYA